MNESALWGTLSPLRDLPAHAEELAEEVWRTRQAMFLSLAVKLSEHVPDLYSSTGLKEQISSFRDRRSEERRRIAEDPLFLIWLRQSLEFAAKLPEANNEERTLAARKFNELGRILKKIEDRPISAEPVWFRDHPVELFRHEVDPLIAQAAPPSYEFAPPGTDVERTRPETAFTLELASEVVGTALERIDRAWPAVAPYIPRFVRIFVHLTDADFRSCSADRYSGVVLLTSDDHSLMEVEESIVHEFGHQLLYRAMELDPLIRKNGSDGQTYTLPWSGAERDLYGYFHAFYIYVLLARYFERKETASEEEARLSFKRRAEILNGLREAIDDFDAEKDFTRTGRALFVALCETIEEFEEREVRSEAPTTIDE